MSVSLKGGGGESVISACILIACVLQIIVVNVDSRMFILQTTFGV